MIIKSSLYLIVSLKVNEADIRKLIMREIVCKGNIKLCNHSILWPFDWLEVIQLSCIKFSEFAKALLNSYIPPKRSDRINWKIEIKFSRAAGNLNRQRKRRLSFFRHLVSLCDQSRKQKRKTWGWDCFETEVAWQSFNWCHACIEMLCHAFV